MKFLAWICAAISVFVVILAASGLYAQDAASLMKQADDLWLKRSASDATAYEAVKLYEQAAQADPKNDVPLYNIARAYQFLGRFAPKNKQESVFKQGMEYAKNALAVNPNSVGGHYWYAACLARSLQNKGITTKMKYAGELTDHLETSIKLDPSYYYGGPDRVIGMIYFKSPLAKNSTAIEHLRKSLKYDPDYSLTLVNLAEVLIKEKQYDEAKQYIDKVLNLKARPGFERELADDKALAKELLDSIPK